MYGPEFKNIPPLLRRASERVAEYGLTRSSSDFELFACQVENLKSLAEPSLRVARVHRLLCKLGPIREQLSSELLEHERRIVFGFQLHALVRAVAAFGIVFVTPNLYVDRIDDSFAILVLLVQ